VVLWRRQLQRCTFLGRAEGEKTESCGTVEKAVTTMHIFRQSGGRKDRKLWYCGEGSYNDVHLEAERRARR